MTRRFRPANQLPAGLDSPVPYTVTDAATELEQARADLDKALKAFNAVALELTEARAAVARVRRLCELTIARSVRVQAVQQARDTLAALDGTYGQEQPAKPRPAPTALPDGAEISEYRADHGRTAWGWNCPGTDTCAGETGLGYGSEDHARVGYAVHAQAHGTPTTTEDSTHA